MSGVVDQMERFLARTEPGPGRDAKDDDVPGTSHLKLRSIPNVPTARLERRLEVSRAEFTGLGLVRFDGPRRQLVEQGIHMLCIEHELNLRRDT